MYLILTTSIGYSQSHTFFIAGRELIAVIFGTVIGRRRSSWHHHGGLRKALRRLVPQSLRGRRIPQSLGSRVVPQSLGLSQSRDDPLCGFIPQSLRIPTRLWHGEGGYLLRRMLPDALCGRGPQHLHVIQQSLCWLVPDSLERLEFPHSLRGIVPQSLRRRGIPKSHGH